MSRRPAAIIAASLGTAGTARRPGRSLPEQPGGVYAGTVDEVIINGGVSRAATEC